MKKKLAIVVTMAGMVVSLAACGKSDADKYVTVPEYKGIETEVEAVNVTQEEIDSYIKSQLASAAVPTPVTDRAVENGDTVNIDYIGKQDGVAFEGGTSAEGGFDLTIGSGSFIPGFEEGLIGAKLAETVDLDLTFPEVYPQNEELAGQAVVFTVTVNTITESVVPELTDEIVPTLAAECKNVEEYKKYVSDSLLEQETENYHLLIGNQVFEKVYADAVVSNPPQELLDKYRKKGDEMAQSYADAYQVSVEEFVTSVLGSTMEEFNAQTDTMAQEMTKEYLVVHSIADKEGLKVSDKEIKEFAQKSLEESGLTSVDEYIEKVGKEEIEVYLLSDKVMKSLESYAVVKEK